MKHLRQAVSNAYCGPCNNFAYLSKRIPKKPAGSRAGWLVYGFGSLQLDPRLTFVR